MNELRIVYFYFMRLLLLIGITLQVIIGHSQCNGSASLCNKPYNEVSYLTTHNAFNCTNNGYSFPNQNYTISEQLNLGVRGFMIDVYDNFGTISVYHGSFLLGSEPLSDVFQEIETFSAANPNEVITIILECYVSSSAIETELNNSGLLGKLYAHTPGNAWPTLQQLIDDGKNVVLFSDQDDALPSQPWYNYMWTNMVETHYSVDAPNLFTHDFNRGDSINDLFIFNHFVTDAVLGIGLEGEASVVNEYNFLMDRIVENYSLKQKFPNFVTLDFVSIGDGLQVVNDLNSNGLSLNEEDIAVLNAYPNPTTGKLTLDLRNPINNDISIELTDLSGRTFEVNDFTQNEGKIILDLSTLSHGYYILKIKGENEYFYTKKIILK